MPSIPSPARSVALEALQQGLSDPRPRLLHGSGKSLYFLKNNQRAREAGQLCLQEQWVEETGEHLVKGKKREPLYRLSRAGRRAVLEQAVAVRMLAGLTDAVDRTHERLESLRADCRKVEAELQALRDTVQEVGAELGTRIEGALDGSPKDVGSGLLAYLRTHAHPGRPLRLAELYDGAAAPQSVSLGDFHDALRELAANKRIRLMPHTQGLNQLDRAECALLIGKEIRAWVELTS